MKYFISLFPVVLLAGLSFEISNAAPSGKPNVIIVLTDDQGYGAPSCHGTPVLKAPQLDILHAESVRFTDFHVSPFCPPSRASLMTGNHAGYPGAYRTSSEQTMLHPDEKTVANLFSENGYATGMVGKWHLGDNAPHRPQDRGFQEVVWHRCGGIGQASDYWGNDYVDGTYERNGSYEEFEGYCTDVWFREGIRFIEANNPVVAVRAKVQIADSEMEAKVEPGSKGIVFEMDLPAGKTELTTWLYDEAGKAGSPYFTEVEAL